MNLNTIANPYPRLHPHAIRKRRTWGRQLAAAAAFLILAACASPGGPGAERIVEGFFGGVAVDEPRAALIGRDVLAAGGSAADAAVAVYFALSVTMPSSASLGGGGVCLVHDAASATTKALEFLARRPGSIPPTANRPSAVPGNPRGFFALHSKYGRLRWEQLVAPAENLARFGDRVSRAFAHDLGAVEAALMGDSETRRVFGAADGQRLVREGEFLAQVDLAGVLSRLRVKGPGDFYGGPLASTLRDAVMEAGGSLSLDDLRLYTPRWLETIRLPFGNQTVHLAPPPAAAGGVAAQLWAILANDDRYQDATGAERPHLLAEAMLRTYADRGRWMADDGTSVEDPSALIAKDRIEAVMSGYRTDRHGPAEGLRPAPRGRPENPAATTFVTVDRDGSAVACALTLNNLFGTGRVARGTGIVIAAMPGQGGRGATSLGPMMVLNQIVNEFYFAAAAAGGVTAPTALINVALGTLIEGRRLEEAMAARRLHHGGVPDLVHYEQGYDRESLRHLLERGHRIAATGALGRVNAVHCPLGIPSNPKSCTVRADPRGFGLAAGAEE